MIFHVTAFWIAEVCPYNGTKACDNSPPSRHKRNLLDTFEVSNAKQLGSKMQIHRESKEAQRMAGRHSLIQQG